MADRDAKVCLTFDFDAISAWPGALGMTSPSAVSRGEFSGRVGVPRVLDVLKREGVSGALQRGHQRPVLAPGRSWENIRPPTLNRK